jgi:hypothetical protein
MHHVEQTREAVYQRFGRSHAIHIRFVTVQPTMPPSRADMEIELQIQGSASTLELCQQFKTSLTAASESLDAAIASTRRKVLGRMTSAQRQSLYEKMQALCENLGALRYKVAVLEENMKRLMKQGCFLEVNSGRRLEELCFDGLGGKDGKAGIRGVMCECEEKWESFSRRCRENGVLEYSSN